MNETEIVERVQEAVTGLGVDDEVRAAGQFFPRGHTGGFFVGGFAGSELGAGLGGIADDVATVGGAIGGSKIADARSGLPERMLVGVSSSTVYGFDTERAHGRAPTQLVFRVPRDRLEVKVHQRVNVRVIELIDEKTGSKVELEGSRLPGFHISEVIEALRA